VLWYHPCPRVCSFVYRNPKKISENDRKRAQSRQASSKTATLVNNDQFLQQAHVPVDQEFYKRYFQEKHDRDMSDPAKKEAKLLKQVF
jgi:hypothetical protein